MVEELPKLRTLGCGDLTPAITMILAALTPTLAPAPTLTPTLTSTLTLDPAPVFS